MTATGPDGVAEMEARYERFGKQLEAEHWGEYVAIASDGRYVLAPTVLEVMDCGAEHLGAGVFVFRVGDLVALKLG